MPRFRPLLWPTILTVGALAVLLALGFWQLERRDWKLSLIDQIESGMTQAPQPLAVVVHDRTEVPEFLSVEVTGIFRHDQEFHLFTHRETQAGYEIITPLALRDGSIVLVNRGFVPERLKDPSTRQAGEVEGEVTVRGWLRRPEERQWFSAENDLKKNLWFVRDPREMAKSRGNELAFASAFFVVADETPNPGGWPKGGMELNLRNNHLLYALTWFGLAIVLVAVYTAFHISRGRLGRDLPR
jgi:surfeit locus 1 family protein